MTLRRPAPLEPARAAYPKHTTKEQHMTDQPTDPAVVRRRKKPVEVDTIQWTGDNEASVQDFTGGASRFYALDSEDRENSDDPEATATIYDKLHFTWVLVYTGQHIVRGVKGEFYPIAEDVLAETYEPAAVQPPAVDQAELRHHIAAVVAHEFGPHRGGDYGLLGIVPRLTEALLALLPAPVDRAAVLREAANRMSKRALALTEGLHDLAHFVAKDRLREAEILDREADELHRMADEAQPAPVPGQAPLTRDGLAAPLAHHADVLAASLHADARSGLPELRAGVERATELLTLHANALTAEEETPAVAELLDSILTFPTVQPAAEPTPLRWGLNDVMWGDDDTITVCLSGPDGEPYTLELDPDRAAALQRDLAGPDGEEQTEADPLSAARATNQRLNLRAQALESELATYRRAVAQWETSERGTYVPLRTIAAIAKAAGRDIENPRWLLHYQRVEQAEAAIERVAALHDNLTAETDLASPDDPITRGAAARRIAAALDGWNPTGAPQCEVEFEGGGRCAKPDGHRPPGSDDPHVPEPAAVAQPGKET